MHGLTPPGMLLDRAVYPPTVGTRVVAIDDSSVAKLLGIRVIRVADFIGVVSTDEGLPCAGCATYSWPIQRHGLISFPCAVANVRLDGSTAWTEAA